MEIGSQGIVHVEFVDRVGQLYDPTTVTGKVLRVKDSVIDSLNFTRISLGIYEAAYVPAVDGDHEVRVEGTGANPKAIERKFNVDERNVPA